MMVDVFVVLNPLAGHGNPEGARSALLHGLAAQGVRYHVHETGSKGQAAQWVRHAVQEGYDLFVAVGGDGTVSQVASGLLHTALPLGIVPTGAGNVLARDLGIPASRDEALRLILSTGSTRAVDAIGVGDSIYVLAIGVGRSARIMRDTGQLDKRHFGRLAYVATAIRALIGLQPHHFDLIIDGAPLRVRASEIAVINLGAAGDRAIRWGEHVRPDDGRVDVCVVRIRTLIDLARAAAHLLLGRAMSAPNLRFAECRHEIRISSRRRLPVQADGDFISYTPVRVRLVPGAVHIIVPSHRTGPS